MSTPVRVRIAPSPTGNLHLGTARTALYNYLYARHNHGTFVFRLEDTDETRSHESYTQDIIDGLNWLGLNWDEGPDIGGPFGPYKQTEKLGHYSKIVNELIKKNAAYFCYCTPEELEELRESQKAQGKAARYDNRCRSLSAEAIDAFTKLGRMPSIRFKIEEPRTIVWNDQIKGEIAIDSSDLGGDMIIVKSNGVSIYNFAVVVDDIDMEITHVIRGEDHIHNTAKQILLYEALQKSLPKFGHVALIFDIERHKLSKRRHGEAVHIDQYRKNGYMPEAMVNYLAQMSWTSSEGQELFTLEEACKMFDLSRVSKSPAVFDIQRLNWFNSHYLRSLPLSVVTERALPYLKIFNSDSHTKSDIEKTVSCLRDGLTVLSEITEAARFFFEEKIDIPAELRETLLSKDTSKKVIEHVLQNLKDMPWNEAAGCKAVVDKIGKELGIKGKDLYWPLRTALSGKTHGPDLGSIFSVLGPDRTKARLESALQLCFSV